MPVYFMSYGAMLFFAFLALFGFLLFHIWLSIYETWRVQPVTYLQAKELRRTRGKRFKAFLIREAPATIASILIVGGFMLFI